jgi:hypothetical protein
VINYDDDIILAAWLIEAGCRLDQLDDRGRSAWQLSQSIAGDSSMMTQFLKSWSSSSSAAARLTQQPSLRLQPPSQSKGFSYVQIHFQKLYFYKTNTRCVRCPSFSLILLLLLSLSYCCIH